MTKYHAHSSLAKVFKYKKYLHFDKKLPWQDVVHDICNPKFVSQHAFFPFIHYDQEFAKFPKKYLHGLIAKRDEPKTRSILYSAHIDRYIYEYYAHLINGKYNAYTKRIGTNRCSLAYRTNRKGQSNIHFAKAVYDKIREIGNALVIIGDFTHYFDEIEHRYLKTMLCKLLDKDILPDDYYAVFRSITKYAYADRDAIREYKGLTHQEFRHLEAERFFEPNEFRRFKKEHVHTHKDKFGIPQGSAISAAFSNVYLMDLDKLLFDFVASMKGMYRRYCDDFVIVLPWENCSPDDVRMKVVDIIHQIPRLILQPEKTQIYHFENNRILRLDIHDPVNGPTSTGVISYLGFSFDGSTVRIRPKTISKFYERMYRKVDNLTSQEQKTGKKISRRKLYKLYSWKGATVSNSHNDKGNFLTYVRRAEKVFGTKENIHKDTAHSWNKMQRRLRKYKHSGGKDK